MTLVKICGITRVEDAAFASGEGADFIGLNFWPSSRRYVSPQLAITLVEAAIPATIVGLFVNASADEIEAIADAVGLDIVQLHGDESPDLVAGLRDRGLIVWKAHAIGAAADVTRLDTYAADAHLLDAPSAGRGGSGQTFDWSHARSAVAAGHRVVLAGGLTPDNVAAAVTQVQPYAVDVASGVESAPGVKDHDRVRAFLAAARTTRSST
jgi:phosphoribosylanthranilate isomerase